MAHQQAAPPREVVRDMQGLSVQAARTMGVRLNQSLHLVQTETTAVTDTLEGATFRKYDTGDKGHLTEKDASAMMAALGYDVGSEYVAGLLEIYGNDDGVLELEGFKRLSQSLGAEEDTETLEDATFREYDAGGKGHLTAAELSALLKDLDYAVDAEYVAGLMEIYGGEGGVQGATDRGFRGLT